MIKEAIDRILGLARPETVKVEEREYSTHSLTPLETPTPETLHVMSLTGLVDYIEKNVDGLDHDNLMVVVDDPNTVRLIGNTLAPFENRAFHLTAKFTFEEFPYERFMSSEDFNIKIQSLFVDTHDRAAVLKQSASVTDEAVATLADDGVTQSTQARTGIARKEEVALKNPVTLAPYRTFPEIVQPASPFVFRMRGAARTGSEPGFALFEADGGKWRNDARITIKKWLTKHLPEGVVVLA